MKHEEVDLKAYVNAGEARRDLGVYFRFCNDQRPHQALGYRDPAEVFHGDQTVRVGGSKEKRCSPEPVLASSTGAMAPSPTSAFILPN